MRFDSPEGDVVQYRPVSGPAVAGLVAGLLSAAGLVSALFWPFGPVGIVLSGLALWQIAARAPVLAGRKIAMAGLMLSITCSVAAPVDWTVHRWLIRRSARQFTSLWFDAIQAGDVAHAHQLMIEAKYREPNEDRLWDFYRKGPRWQQELKTLVETPVVRVLLALGTKARVRYYDLGDETEFENRQSIRLFYSVTYEDQIDTKTFFMAVSLDRIDTKDGAHWQVVHADGGVHPPGVED